MLFRSKLAERIGNAERRNALAIDDVGEQVARVTERMNQRSERASDDLAERIRQSEERTARLLDEAREQRLAPRLERFEFEFGGSEVDGAGGDRLAGARGLGVALGSATALAVGKLVVLAVGIAFAVKQRNHRLTIERLHQIVAQAAFVEPVLGVFGFFVDERHAHAGHEHGFAA